MGSEKNFPLILGSILTLFTLPPDPDLLFHCTYKMKNNNNNTVFKHSSSSVAQLCLTLCDPMDCNTPGFPVHHQLPELAQTHVPQVGDAIQPSNPLSSPPPPAFIKVFPSESVVCIRSAGQGSGVLASASVPPVNIQD